jgi:hypothetical protein
MPKSYRIRTQVGVDKYINVKLDQDFDFLEILSLKINQSDLYTKVCSDYGVVVGRVVVNGGFGLPNAKVSIFIPLAPEDELNPTISELYPYKTLSDNNELGYRYNLLPHDPSYSVHSATGTFPNREEVLIDQTYIEVYDKYYKYTVKTNDSGDYMIFGVPIGTQTVFMDVDLSDIGCFSLTPQDLINAGQATQTQVNGAKFKSSSNLNELPQIKTVNKNVDISPLWGQEDICQIGITRVDFDLTNEANVTINPTAIFIGSLISTTNEDSIKTNCKPKNNTGNLCELTSGPGQILSIRQTIYPDKINLPILEEYKFEQDGKIIDGDGSFLANVPMNLDYIITNEFGEQIISNDPTKGIPTKGKYRFKFKWNNEGGLQNDFQRANFLVPNIKEYGWTNSGTDPFNPTSAVSTIFNTTAGNITSDPLPPFTEGGLLFNGKTNSDTFTVYVNGLPYYGDTMVIPVNVGDLISIDSNPVDNTQPQQFDFTFFPQGYFDLLRSYSFSLDWDDYVDPISAINCEDTFYEMNYNKVYTTAMFLDRYKNGVGRAKHLGIKEIDNRSCKSEVNTFPSNDIIKNFDTIFFIFNVFMSILAYPLIVLLFVAHFIAWAWPVLKYLLIVLGVYFLYDAISEMIDWINSLAETFAFSVPGGPIINAGLILKIIAKGISFLFRMALASAFIYFTIKYLLKIKNFPRIGLPMISYPECTSCDCDCGFATLDDDIDQNSVNEDIESQQANNGVIPIGQANTFLAPVNMSSSYDVKHPNSENNSSEDLNSFQSGPFWAGPCLPGATDVCINCGIPSLITSAMQQNITGEIAARGILDYARLFSGYDILSSSGTVNVDKIYTDEFSLYHAPQPFLFAAWRESPFEIPPYDRRNWAFPKTVTFPQRLNEFNTRDKYFDTYGGANRIKTFVNPSLNFDEFFEDQIIVLLANTGTKNQMAGGKPISFNNPRNSNGNVNITGATLNQLGNHSITGTTTTGQTIITVTYANPSNISDTTGIPKSFIITQPAISNIASSTINDEVANLQYTTDIEYYQMITGMSVSDFIYMSGTDPNTFPTSFLKHNIKFSYCCGGGNVLYDAGESLTQMTNYNDFEIIILNRGVDVHTAKQNIKYDLSKIFGKSYGNVITPEGDYYLNIPIQPIGSRPISHNTTDNSPPPTSPKLYFPSYNFNIGPADGSNPNYTSFISTNPYYYLSTDDLTLANYQPVPGWTFLGALTLPTPQNKLILKYNNYTIPSFILPGPPYTNSPYIGGGTFISKSSNTGNPCFYVYNPWTNDNYSYNGLTPDGNGKNQLGIVPSNRLSALYSPAYYRYGLPGVNFNDRSKIVMRSDRLPTSTKTEDGAEMTTGVPSKTGFAMHQNNNFRYYFSDFDESAPTIGLTTSEISGEGFDSPTQTFDCDTMVSLQCYQGSGNDVSVIPPDQCVVPEGRVKGGCYCLLNKKYLTEYSDDVDLFLEWKTRFTITFAACRGVFAQVFQNNWINGVLYMYSFNKTTTYAPLSTIPTYNYCDDVIVFNELTNSFYYRSSPWKQSTQQFIGKNKPLVNSLWPSSIINGYPGLGYNEKQIQFPTTIADLGPRDKFITEICNNSNFNGYMVDQVKSTSYQDTSDIIQVGFLSRLLNETFRQAILPITTGGGSSEGKGIIQFFNSTRKADRIDGDFAQALSINSEWKINPFIFENYPNNNSIYFGSDNQSPARPVFGVFFETPTDEYKYRRRFTPGYETYSQSPLIEDFYGFPKTQDVPHYQWIIDSSPNIFGSENNNWNTISPFFHQGYQKLDFNNPFDPYFQSSTTKLGIITNFDVNGQPLPTPQVTNQVLVGAPFHFYFGLNNGKTAIDKFVKLYVNNEG